MVTATGIVLWCAFLMIVGAIVGAFLRVWKCPSRRGGHQWRLVGFRVSGVMIREDMQCKCCGKAQTIWH